MISQIQIDLNKVCRHNVRRNCDIICNICDQSFSCKMCHDEEIKKELREEDVHELIEKDMKEIKCRQCDTLQGPCIKCTNCQCVMANYVCLICNNFSYNQNQYHCNNCNSCHDERLKENMRFCVKCRNCHVEKEGLECHDQCKKYHTKDLENLRFCEKCIKCYPKQQNMYHCEYCKECILNTGNVTHCLKCKKCHSKFKNIYCDQCKKCHYEEQKVRHFCDKCQNCIIGSKEISYHCNDCQSQHKTILRQFYSYCDYCQSCHLNLENNNKFFKCKNCKSCHQGVESNYFYCQYCEKCNKGSKQDSYHCFEDNKCHSSFESHFLCEKCQICHQDPEDQYFHCERCVQCNQGKKENWFHCDKCQQCFQVKKELTFHCDQCNACKYGKQEDYYHCNKCAMCINGKQEDYFHCDKCNKCNQGKLEEYYHCDKCNNCRKGKQEDNFHCDKCNKCFQGKNIFHCEMCDRCINGNKEQHQSIQHFFCDKCNRCVRGRKEDYYHCDGCKICMQGNQQNNFHCYKCKKCHKGQQQDYKFCDKCNQCMWNFSYYNKFECNKCCCHKLKKGNFYHCQNCDVCLQKQEIGENEFGYKCEQCKNMYLYDSVMMKCNQCKQVHPEFAEDIFYCQKCNECIVGLQEEFFHCDNCKTCLQESNGEHKLCVCLNCKRKWQKIKEQEKEIFKPLKAEGLVQSNTEHEFCDYCKNYHIKGEARFQCKKCQICHYNSPENYFFCDFCEICHEGNQQEYIFCAECQRCYKLTQKHKKNLFKPCTQQQLYVREQILFEKCDNCRKYHPKNENRFKCINCFNCHSGKQEDYYFIKKINRCIYGNEINFFECRECVNWHPGIKQKFFHCQQCNRCYQGNQEKTFHCKQCKKCHFKKSDQMIFCDTCRKCIDPDKEFHCDTCKQCFSLQQIEFHTNCKEQREKGCAACQNPILENQSSINTWCGHLIHIDNLDCLKRFRDKKCFSCIDPSQDDIRYKLSIQLRYQFEKKQGSNPQNEQSQINSQEINKLQQTWFWMDDDLKLQQYDDFESFIIESAYQDYLQNIYKEESKKFQINEKYLIDFELMKQVNLQDTNKQRIVSRGPRLDPRRRQMQNRESIFLLDEKQKQIQKKDLIWFNDIYQKFPSINKILNGLLDDYVRELSKNKLNEIQKKQKRKILEKKLLDIFKSYKGKIEQKDLDEPIKFEELMDKNSNIVRAIVHIYTMESTIPYSLNLGIRDRNKEIHQNLGPFANILKLIIINAINENEQDYDENIVVFRGIKLQYSKVNDYILNYKNAQILQLNGMQSTSLSQQIAEKMAFDYKQGEVPVIFEIHLQKNLQGQMNYFVVDSSVYPDEKEVIIKDGQNFFISFHHFFQAKNEKPAFHLFKLEQSNQLIFYQ